MDSSRFFDVLIIGSGLAGLSAALASADKGLEVAVLTKERDMRETNSWYAQGGIVASGDEDTPDLLAEDIIKAGDYLNCRDAVELIAKEGPSIVEEYLIKRAKIPFCRLDDGSLDKTREAAHSVRRILHVKDHTGESIEKGLLEYVSTYDNIHFFPGFSAVEIITNSHNSTDYQERYKTTTAIGIYALDERQGEVVAFFGSAIVIAAGGVGNLFFHTSNPPGATGDGIAMASRAGAEIINAEYVQFHPTVLFHRDVNRFLITESMRGEGARLMNHRGEYFMERYNPQLKDLAPRDEVARAIYREMDSSGSKYVFLDARGITGLQVEDRFPGIFQKCMSVGIDIRKEPIPVVPAAHYFCGGIKVNLSGQTNIAGLYAVGEASCTGVHGANRLASVSLLEALVFGIKAGQHIAGHCVPPSKGLMKSIPDWVYPKSEEDIDPVLIHQDLLNIQMTMWNYAGISRTPKRLLRALSDLNYMSHRIERFYKQAKITRELIELRNAVLTATLIARAAYANTKSLGCHYIET